MCFVHKHYGGHCYRPGFKAWSDCQDRTDNSCSDEAEDHLEWQEYHAKIQNQVDALLGPLYIPICLRVMDPNERSWKEDTGNRDEMLSQTPRHLLQRPHHQWRSDQPHPWNNRAVWRPPGNSEEKKTEILRSHHKVIRTLQNYTARHCTREKSKRKTEEKMGGQHTRMDGYGAGKDNKRGWGQRGMEENDCKIFCGAPTVTPTAGYVRRMIMQNADFGQILCRRASTKRHVTSRPMVRFSQTWYQKMRKTWRKQNSWKDVSRSVAVTRQSRISYRGYPQLR